MKQPHEFKADYKIADKIIDEAQKVIDGKYYEKDSAGNLKKIVYPMIMIDKNYEIALKVSATSAILEEDNKYAKTEKAKQNIARRVNILQQQQIELKHKIDSDLKF